MRPIYDATFLIPARLGKITYVRMFYPWEFFSGIFRLKSPRKSQIGNYLAKLWGMVLHPGSVEIKLWVSAMNTKLKRRKEMATEKQVAYALALLDKAGYSTKFMNAKFKELGATLRERSGSVKEWLSGMNRSEISRLIDKLK